MFYKLDTCQQVFANESTRKWNDIDQRPKDKFSWSGSTDDIRLI